MNCRQPPLWQGSQCALSAGPISCLEYRATGVLHSIIVTTAAVLVFPLLVQTIISNQMRPRRLRVAALKHQVVSRADVVNESFVDPHYSGAQVIIMKLAKRPLAAPFLYAVLFSPGARGISQVNY